MSGTYEKDASIEWPVISTYTSEQATKDGVLVSVAAINPKWGKGAFSHITANLLDRGYREEDGSPRLVNIVDLLNQALTICKGTDADHFYSGRIEFPDGARRKIFIAQNETGRFTIMLPGDY